MKSAFYIIFFKSCFFENGIIRQEIDGGACLFCLPDYRQKTVHKVHNRKSFFIMIFINETTGFYSHIQPVGKGVYNRRTYPVQTTACLICVVVKFTTCM